MLTIRSRLRIIFGWIYFLAHALMLAFAGVYLFLSLTVAPSGPEAILIVLIPILGLFVGHWVRKASFGAWRITLMAVSFLISSVLFYLSFCLPAVFHKPEEKSFHKPAISQGENGNTALHVAVMNGSQEIAQALLSTGADVNARNDFGQTPLHVVRDKEIAAMLIVHGANVNARDKDFEMSPIFFQDIEVTKLLVEHGADVNFRSKKNNTPLIWYAYSGYLEGIKFLLDHGADVNARNSDGSSALDIAVSFGHPELAEFLKSRGAKTADEMKKK